MNPDQNREDLELRKALMQLADRAPGPQEFAEVVQRPAVTHKRSSRRLLVAAAVLVVLGIGGGLWWAAQDEPGTALFANQEGEQPPEPDAQPGVTTQGVWTLVSADIDGQSVASGLHLEIDGSMIGGETLCEQSFGGEMGGPLPQTTAEGCDPDDERDLEVVDQRFMSAITNGPVLEGDRLIFTDVGVRLTYERTVEFSAEDLFAALDNEALAADSNEIFLDPEAGRRGDFAKLARLEHPSREGRFFVGTDSELVCFVISSDVASLTACDQPRRIALRSTAFSLETREGPTGLRAALIPDAFVEAAGLSDIGLASGNVVVVAPDTSPGDYVLVNDADDEFVVSVTGEPGPDSGLPDCRLSDIGLFGLDPSTLTEVRLVVFNTSTRACTVATQGVTVENSSGETLELSQVGEAAPDVLVEPNSGVAIIIRSAEVCSANLPDGLYGTVRYRFNDTDGQQTDEAAAVVGCAPTFEISADAAVEFGDQLRVSGAIVVQSAYQPPVRPESADAGVGGIVGITAQGCVTLSGQGATFPAGSLWSDERGALILPNGDFRPVGEEAIGGGAEESRILQTPGLVPDEVVDYFGNCGFGPESEIVSMSTS